MTFKSAVFVLALTTISSLVGCASVPMAPPEHDARAKSFSVKPGKANIYVYRNESMGAAVKMPVTLNGKPMGATGAKTFLLAEVPSGKHILVSKSENDYPLELMAEPGRNYFIWQEVKMGLLYARSQLHITDDVAGRAGVRECQLAGSLDQ